MRPTGRTSIIAIEEPESHLHPDAIHSLVDVINGVSENHQVVITTHNPLFVQRNAVSENVIVNENIILNHYPDSTKSRSSYLPLLELSVKENPKNDRNMHYLGREYMYYGKYNEAIDTLIKHLHLKNATWKDERCASMRFIARCYKYLKRYDESEMWLLKAIKEAPYLRDPFIELALLYYELNDFQKVYDTVTQALEIKYHQKTYNNEIFSWNETPYDLLSISCFNLGKYDESLEAINHALEISPYDERILKNKEIILNKLDI